MIDMNIVVLQNFINLQELVPDLFRETCLTSPHDGSQFINIKAEDVTDIQDEQAPLQQHFL
jgi:hypothetical protein